VLVYHFVTTVGHPQSIGDYTLTQFHSLGGMLDDETAWKQQIVVDVGHLAYWMTIDGLRLIQAQA